MYFNFLRKIRERVREPLVNLPQNLLASEEEL